MRDVLRNDLNRDAPSQLSVGCPIDISHTARPEVTLDLVMCEFRSNREGLPFEQSGVAFRQGRDRHHQCRCLNEIFGLLFMRQ